MGRSFRSGTRTRAAENRQGLKWGCTGPRGGRAAGDVILHPGLLLGAGGGADNPANIQLASARELVITTGFPGAGKAKPSHRKKFQESLGTPRFEGLEAGVHAVSLPRGSLQRSPRMPFCVNKEHTSLARSLTGQGHESKGAIDLLREIPKAYASTMTPLPCEPPQPRTLFAPSSGEKKDQMPP